MLPWCCQCARHGSALSAMLQLYDCHILLKWCDIPELNVFALWLSQIARWPHCPQLCMFSAEPSKVDCVP